MSKLIIQTAKYTTKTFKCASNNFLNRSISGVCLNFARSITTTQCLQTDRLFTRKHEWINVKDKIGVVGISDYAQEALGDVVYVQLPEVGTMINKETECGALESVKSASELFSPVSGKVIEKNEQLESVPGLINSSCYEQGWLFKVELSDPNELKSLMDEKAYRHFLETEV